jgi:FkbM family methyltransferase
MIHEEFLQAYLPTKRQALAINVGAHDGLWVDKFKDLFSSVIAVEANPKYAERLRKTFLEPPIGNVQVVNAAGWICSGQVMRFNVRDGVPMQSALACRDLLREDAVSQTIDVPTICIDDIQKDACDLLWVDVEGAEVQVMMGATRTIEAYHPQIVVECHEVEHRAWMMTWLMRAGYNIAVIHNPTIGQQDSLWDRNTHLIGTYWQYRGTW